jgi:protein phosphatase
MSRRFIAVTDPGLVRPYNQDNYYLDSQGRFFVVADGMGGHAGGQEASRIAAEKFKSYLEEYWESPLSSEELLQKAFHEANEEILKDQSAHPERADMGTTAVVVIFRKNQPWCAHIGDSRLYRLRDQILEQISEDHTWVARAVQAGELSKEEAKVHPWRHVLSQCLGRKDILGIDVQPIDVQPGDRLLICSDGLTEEVSDELILSLLQEKSDLEEAARILVEEAKRAGGSDNITIVLVSQEQ